MGDEARLHTVIFKKSPFYEYLTQLNISEEVADKEDVVEPTWSRTEETVEDKNLVCAWCVGLKRIAHELRFCVECHVRLKLLAHVLQSSLLCREDIACLTMVHDKWKDSSIANELLHRFRSRAFCGLTIFISLVAASLSHWLLKIVFTVIALCFLVVFALVFKWKRSITLLLRFFELQLNFDSQVRKALRFVREQEMTYFGCSKAFKQEDPVLNYAIFNPSICMELRTCISSTCKAMSLSLLPLLSLRRGIYFTSDAELRLAFEAFPVDANAAYLEFEHHGENGLPLSFLKRNFVLTQMIRSRYLRAFVLHYFERSSLALKELHACIGTSQECTERLGSLLSAHNNLLRYSASLDTISRQWGKKLPDREGNLFAVCFRSAASHLRFALERCTEFANQLENVPDDAEQLDNCEILFNTLINELRSAIVPLEDALAVRKHPLVNIFDDGSEHSCLPKTNPSLSSVTEISDGIGERIILDEVFEAYTNEAERKEKTESEHREAEREACYERLVLNELKNVLKFRRKDMEIREEHARQRMDGAEAEPRLTNTDENTCENGGLHLKTMQHSDSVEKSENEEGTKCNCQLGNETGIVMPKELRSQFVKQLQSTLSGRFP